MKKQNKNELEHKHTHPNTEPPDEGSRQASKEQIREPRTTKTRYLGNTENHQKLRKTEPTNPDTNSRKHSNTKQDTIKTHLGTIWNKHWGTDEKPRENKWWKRIQEGINRAIKNALKQITNTQKYTTNEQHE